MRSFVVQGLQLAQGMFSIFGSISPVFPVLAIFLKGIVATGVPGGVWGTHRASVGSPGAR